MVPDFRSLIVFGVVHEMRNRWPKIDGAIVFLAALLVAEALSFLEGGYGTGADGIRAALTRGLVMAATAVGIGAVTKYGASKIGEAIPAPTITPIVASKPVVIAQSGDVGR